MSSSDGIGSCFRLVIPALTVVDGVSGSEERYPSAVSETVAPAQETDIVQVTLGRMSTEWREAFLQAPGRRSVTRIKRLGQEAGKVDQLLSARILELAERYDIKELQRLSEWSS